MKHAAAVLAALLAACAVVRVEDDCTYVREVKFTYQCERAGKIEHFKIQLPE